MATFSHPLSDANSVTWTDSNSFGAISDRPGTTRDAHTGADLNWGSSPNADLGQEVYSMFPGTVKQVLSVSGYGGTGQANLVLIWGTAPDGQKFTTVYGHLNTSVSVGALVTAGQQIGTLRDLTDIGSGAHLHEHNVRGWVLDAFNGYADPFTPHTGSDGLPEATITTTSGVQMTYVDTDALIAKYSAMVAGPGEGADTFTGTTSADSVRFYGGNDTAYGGGGNDSLMGDSGSDRLYGDANDDTLKGGSENDVLYGGDGSDVLDGEEGDDFLYGGDGTDTVSYVRGNGNDINLETGVARNGNMGVDLIYNFEGVIASYFGDAITGNSDNNVILALDGENWARGNGGQDAIVGGKDRDEFLGDSGDDLLQGLGGNDVLRGGMTTIPSRVVTKTI